MRLLYVVGMHIHAGETVNLDDDGLLMPSKDGGFATALRDINKGEIARILPPNEGESDLEAANHE